MGLRLAQLEEGVKLSRSTDDWRASVNEVLAGVTAATRLGRPDDLRAALAPAAEWDDRQRAFQVLKHAVEIVSNGGQGLPDLGWARLFAELAAILTVELERDPVQPALLNSLGVLHYELGEIGAAKALFAAAVRLDPTLPHAQKNLASAREREHGRLAVPLAKPLAIALRALAVRARTIAARAKAPSGLTLSLCMIVKDEEEMLPGCLEAIRGAVDEIIIVDTGSTDRTVEIAESFGARVLHFPWNGSFADARNVGHAAATSDWIVYLDADEHLVPEDAAQLRELTSRTWREASSSAPASSSTAPGTRCSSRNRGRGLASCRCSRRAAQSAGGSSATWSRHARRSTRHCCSTPTTPTSSASSRCARIWRATSTRPPAWPSACSRWAMPRRTTPPPSAPARSWR